MKINNYQIQVIVLWILCIIGMILHFNYHVGKIFYGINVVRPGAEGKIPAMAQVLKTVYYHLPMIFIVMLLYMKQKWFRLAMFIITIPYTISHIMHVVDEFKKPVVDYYAQIPLLSIVLIISIILNKASWEYFKNENE
jgi:hypothetical protein